MANHLCNFMCQLNLPNAGVSTAALILLRVWTQFAGEEKGDLLSCRAARLNIAAKRKNHLMKAGNWEENRDCFKNNIQLHGPLK